MIQSDGQSLDKPTVIARSSWKRKLKALVWVIVLVSIVVALGIWYWRDSASVVDRKLVSGADFTAYAPRQAPAGYKIQQDQTSLENGLLTYKFTGSSGESDIIVTVQDRPDGFNMNEISKGGSISSTAMDSGTLYNLSSGETSQFLLDTGVSLVYITSPSNVDTGTVNSLTNSLRKLN